MNFSVLMTYITPHRRVLTAVLGLLLVGSLNVPLLNGSVAENIAYGAPAVSRERIEAAAKAANAHAFITQLPDGYDTVIGASSQFGIGGQGAEVG